MCNLNHIELFAGCGGLTLGLEAVGFNLVMANELSPMAAETFAYNFFQESLNESMQKKITHTLWLSSNHNRSEMNNRLREDPRTFPAWSQDTSDIKDVNSLNGNLIVGSIVELNKWLEQKPDAQKHLKEAFGRKGGLDLVSGGPPCQSFSMAGLRQLSNERNILPWEFAKFVKMTQPKFALLENVSGILRPFKQDNKSFYAWYEVTKAFAEIGYVPLCLHVNAKFAGVAQNRPRFILLGIREDIYQIIKLTFNDAEKELFNPFDSFFNQIKGGKPVVYGDIPYYDPTKIHDEELFSHSFLRELIRYKEKPFTVFDAIDDLRSGRDGKQSDYISLIRDDIGKLLPNNDIKNHELRRNSLHVQRRFRLYQVLQQVSITARKEAQKLLQGQSKSLTLESEKELLGFDYLIDVDLYKRFSKADEFIKYLEEHGTKKRTQKALIADQPASAALSIPDDVCHYHHDELRTLTVREMARIQSFPDNFEFRSKITTGGNMRKFEVPQYTQVGNAVPPLLGKALGQTIKNLLIRIK